jgi:hypothetical protein
MAAQAGAGVALERARPNGVALTDDERRWDQLVRMANVYANSNLVAKGMQGKPQVCMSALLLCDAIGVDPRTAMGAIDVIENKLEPRAQVYIAAANAHGWETKWGHVDRDPDTGDVIRVRHVEPNDESAELLIRPYGTDNDAWESYTFTAEQARKAHLLDEWVENQVDTGDFWPDGNAKYTTEKFVLGREGVDVPDWVEKELRAGRIKHNNQWFNWRADMLSARCGKRAVKRAAPGVMFGAVPASIPTRTAAAVVDHLPGDDDDVVDGEIVTNGNLTISGDDEQGPPPVDQSPSGGGPAPTPRPRPAGYPLRADDQATDLERTLAKSLLDTLNPAQYQQVQQLAKTAGVPNIDGARFGHDHVVILSDLIAQVRAETPPAKTEAEATGNPPAPGATGADGPSPSTREKGASSNANDSAARRPGPSARQPTLDPGRPFDAD